MSNMMDPFGAMTLIQMTIFRIFPESLNWTYRQTDIQRERETGRIWTDREAERHRYILADRHVDRQID